LVKNIVATNVLNLLKSFIINVFGILPVIFVAVKNDIILETLDLNKKSSLCAKSFKFDEGFDNHHYLATREQLILRQY
jgi:hypothetical protein